MAKRIVPRKGDITNTHANAIVNAGNTSLWLGSGVAGAIRVRGGPGIQKELDRIAKVREHRRTVSTLGTQIWKFPCELGETVVTHGGTLKADLVLHAAVMDCKGPYKAYTDLDIIYESTRNAVLKARELSLYGVAFPLFGTGVGGIPVYESVGVMLQALIKYALDDQNIRLYAYEDSAHMELLRALEDRGTDALQQ